MSVVLCIDFGLKRCGLALSDPNRIIASPLETIASIQLENWLEQAIPQRQIKEIVLGYPTRLDGSDSHVTENVRLLKTVLEKKFPAIPIHLFDERFSSKMASEVSRPTRSSSANGPIGKLQPPFIAVSMSAIFAVPCSSMRMALLR